MFQWFHFRALIISRNFNSFSFLELRIFKPCRKEFHLRLKFTSINNVYFNMTLIII